MQKKRFESEKEKVIISHRFLRDSNAILKPGERNSSCLNVDETSHESLQAK